VLRELAGMVAHGEYLRRLHDRVVDRSLERVVVAHLVGVVIEQRLDARLLEHVAQSRDRALDAAEALCEAVEALALVAALVAGDARQGGTPDVVGVRGCDVDVEAAGDRLRTWLLSAACNREAGSGGPADEHALEAFPAQVAVDLACGLVEVRVDLLLAVALGLSREQVESRMAVERSARGFDEPVGADHDGSATLGELIDDSCATEAFERLPRTLDIEQLPGMLATLDEREPLRPRWRRVHPARDR
jgi:hypothetical protein